MLVWPESGEGVAYRLRVSREGSAWPWGDDADRGAANRARAVRRARARLRRYVVANRCARLLTLTYAQGVYERRQVVADWARFARRLRRAFGPVAWARALELHPQGHGWHIHAALGRYIPKAVLAALWGHGFVDVRRLRSGSGPAGRQDARRAAVYLSKYLAKAWESEDREAWEHAYEVAEGFQPEVVERLAWDREGAVLAAVEVMWGELPSWRWESDAAEDWRGPPVVCLAWE